MKGLKGFRGVVYLYNPLIFNSTNMGEFGGTLDVKKKNFVKFVLMISIYVFFFN